MRSPIMFIIFVSSIIILTGTVVLLFLRFFNKEWWLKKIVRNSAILIPILGLFSFWGFVYFTLSAHSKASYIFAAVSVTMLLLEICLLLSLPLSGVIHWINKLFDKKTAKAKAESVSEIHRNRRIFLKGAAASVPFVSLGFAGAGFAKSFSTARVYLKRIRIENLPPALENFRILHLSDLHLRELITVRDLEAVLENAIEYKPDMIAVTGDIADDLSQLPDAISLLEQFPAPAGRYACLGNHEYFRGIPEVKRAFDSSSIPLLVNDSILTVYKGQHLNINGIDDPRSLRGDTTDFFKNCLIKTVKQYNYNEFSILMSHRPNAFPYAAEFDIPLTLAGHTHGGQVGIFERSLFETSDSELFLWGHYNINRSHLYTSSGMGHWFPFRLGCPNEAPVIELHS